MNPYKPITLTHAMLKETDGQPKQVRVVLGTVGFYYHSESSASTLVGTSAGIVPVLETPEQIDSLIITTDFTPGGN